MKQTIKRSFVFSALVVLATACAGPADQKSFGNQLVVSPLPVDGAVRCPKKKPEKRATDDMRTNVRWEEIAKKHSAMQIFFDIRNHEIRHEAAYEAVLKGQALNNLSQTELKELFVRSDLRARADADALAQHIEMIGVDWTEFEQALIDVVVDRGGSSFLHDGRPRDIRTEFLKVLYACELYQSK